MHIVTCKVIWVVIGFLGKQVIVINFFEIERLEIKSVENSWSCVSLIGEEIKVFVILTCSLILDRPPSREWDLMQQIS